VPEEGGRSKKFGGRAGEIAFAAASSSSCPPAFFCAETGGAAERRRVDVPDVLTRLERTAGEPLDPGPGRLGRAARCSSVHVLNRVEYWVGGGVCTERDPLKLLELPAATPKASLKINS
jgi:hypothetical protein